MSTACNKCSNLIQEGTIWYDLYCKASEVKPDFGPLTGKPEVLEGNEKYMNIREVNLGDCKKFKRRSK